MERVNWKAHGASINRTGISKTHITKLVHDILPTNDRVHKFNQIQPENALTVKYQWKTGTMSFAAETPSATNRGLR